MTLERKMELIAEILDVDVESINPDTVLTDLDEWDSVAYLSFMAMMDEEFDKEIKGAEIKKFVTVQDALNVMGE